MLWRSLSLGAATALGLLSGCSPEPCTSCLKVSGQYVERTEPSSVDCRAWRFLLFGGGEYPVTLTQSGGSSLRLESIVTLTGELHSDMSASFGPSKITFRPVDGAGNPDPNGTPTPGLLYLHGFFSDNGGTSKLFEGTYVFVTDDEIKCEMTSKVRWTR